MNPPPFPPSGYSPGPGYPPPARRQGLGCFAVGCIVMVAVCLLLIGGVGGLGWYAYRVVRPFVGTRPVAIRIYPATAAQYSGVVDRFHTFLAALDATHRATLVLTADDLNTLVARAPEEAALRGRAYFSIVNNQLVCEASFPLRSRQNGLAGPQVYYVSGCLYLSASFADGEFTFVSNRLDTVDGKPAPALLTALVENPSFSRGFTQSVNDGFRKKLDQNPAASAFVAKIRSINIQDNRIVITAADGQSAPVH